MPNFDDLHYVFLTSKGHEEHPYDKHEAIMEKYTYDFLNTIAYISVILVTFLYNRFLTKTQVKYLIFFSQILALASTGL